MGPGEGVGVGWGWADGIRQVERKARDKKVMAKGMMDIQSDGEKQTVKGRVDLRKGEDQGRNGAALSKREDGV